MVVYYYTSIVITVMEMYYSDYSHGDFCMCNINFVLCNKSLQTVHLLHGYIMHELINLIACPKNL